jgi:hypothetical protein
VDAFGVLDEVLADYQSFVNGFLNIQDGRVRQKVEKKIDDGLLWPEPWLALNPAFKPGGIVTELVHKRRAAPRHPPDLPGAQRRRRVRPRDRLPPPPERGLRGGEPQKVYVLTTGTGSGKSMTYIVPTVDRVLREGSGQPNVPWRVVAVFSQSCPTSAT